MHVTRTFVYVLIQVKGVYSVLKLTDVSRKVFVCCFANQFILRFCICSVLYKSLSVILDETKEEFPAKD